MDTIEYIKMNNNMNKILILVLVLLISIGGLLYFMKGMPDESGIDLSDRQFAVENIETIGMISLERKRYPKMIFTLKDKQWYLNTGREASNDAVNNMTSIIKKLKIKYIPNQLASENIKESIKKDGVKIMLFDKNQKHLKTFYIGSDLGYGTGTAFLMEGAKQPYVMFVPSFSGSIRTRFVFSLNEYQSKSLFKEKAEDIVEAEIKYPLDRSSSFKISKKMVGFDLINPYDNTKLPKQNDKLIEAYLENFSNVAAEYNESNNAYRDTILNSQPFCEIILTLKNKNQKTAVVYSLPNIEWGEHKFSPKDNIGGDTRYIIHTGDNQLMLIQHRVLKKIFMAFDSFAIRN